MFEPVTLPLWLVVVLALASLWAGIRLLFLPGTRRLLRRRANRAIDRLNQTLQLKIQPFKLTSRDALIDRLAFDDVVLEAVDAYAEETGMGRAEAHELARAYAAEIVPSFSAYAYFRVGVRLARRLAHLLYRVRITRVDAEALRQVNDNAVVVFIMNHRSNMDYVLVSYIAAGRTALSYAVGEWAQFWPVRPLIRMMGAYFIRRVDSDTLYRRVLARYIQLALEAGVTQAVYPEGGLSRDGNLRQAKLGVLSYMINGFKQHEGRDLVFVPVGINYDRVIEDRNLTRDLDTGKQRSGAFFSLLRTFGFLSRSVGQMIIGRWRHLGLAAVSFGKPISLRGWLKRHSIELGQLNDYARRNVISDFGNDVLKAAGKRMPVVPVAVLSELLLQGDDLQDSGELHELALVRIEALAAKGASIPFAQADRHNALEAGLKILEIRQFIERRGSQIIVKPEARPLLQYYANSLKLLI